MPKEQIKARLFQIFSDLNASNVPSLASSLLDELDDRDAYTLLQEVMHEAGKREVAARSLNRWADRTLLEKRKPVSL